MSVPGIEIRCRFEDLPRVQEILGTWLALGPLPVLFEVEEIATGLWQIRVRDREGRRCGRTMVKRFWKELPAEWIARELVELLDRA